MKKIAVKSTNISSQFIDCMQRYQSITVAPDQITQRKNGDIVYDEDIYKTLKMSEFKVDFIKDIDKKISRYAYSNMYSLFFSFLKTDSSKLAIKDIMKQITKNIDKNKIYSENKQMIGTNFVFIKTSQQYDEKMKQRDDRDTDQETRTDAQKAEKERLKLTDKQKKTFDKLKMRTTAIIKDVKNKIQNLENNWDLTQWNTLKAQIEDKINILQRMNNASSLSRYFPKNTTPAEQLLTSIVTDLNDMINDVEAFKDLYVKSSSSSSSLSSSSMSSTSSASSGSLTSFSASSFESLSNEREKRRYLRSLSDPSTKNIKIDKNEFNNLKPEQQIILIQIIRDGRGANKLTYTLV